MTRDEVLRMAGEAGTNRWGSILHFTLEELERFAALVAAHEREACAKVCDAEKGIGGSETWYQCANELANQIRARGNNE